MDRHAPSPQQRYAMFPLRVTLAIVFLAYGIRKWTHLEAESGVIAAAGIPAPDVFVHGLAALEVLGGLAMFTGFLARWAAAALLPVMAGALFLVKLPYGFFGVWDLEVALVGGLVTLILAGPGDPLFVPGRAKAPSGKPG